MCHDCPRIDSKPDESLIREFQRPHEVLIDPEKCFLAQGLMLHGPGHAHAAAITPAFKATCRAPAAWVRSVAYAIRAPPPCPPWRRWWQRLTQQRDVSP